ncbi:protein transport protein SEC20 [Marchantia polymorpha subsp. ruderalis]|uniref:Sec20 C-terminal domain-containing protein n=2 Tax=Marchantia polymorpha TaxID=3197 RepID=A0AAF6APT2_MARPO|nr:hypothetical protein MARPO_0019s0137 [Marchantia polymorpha]BBM98452.1 hypothetical protein Mp_1g13670 [Marchantia polymorpha subsp. ruderalis]PTQ44724.1 hypothetical protein MARPO_0019s0137 [Marchantia polymorpha]PTQ44725.1 hypothetical protein MARPO_0019s0137 [Marchantia polymorpha]BAS01240.1 secretion 20 [Marchantia polymorpha]|eukprot:PTQ44723.1 hypothetical protein MARPO_0019s0137 [Marchantia polymorpha]
MDQDVEEAAELVRNQWEKTSSDLIEKIQAVETCGSVGGLSAKGALPQLNAAVQDRFTTLQSLLLRMDLISQQHPSEDMGEACVQKLDEWKKQLNELRLSLRNANRNAKLNIERAAKRERELLLSGGEEATTRRRILQTQAGMVAGAESITDGLRRTRQMMVQEVERSVNTIQTLDQSNITLRDAKEEYFGARSILNSTRRLLSTMSRSDLIDRAILVVGIVVFLLVCNYIFLKRLGIWKALRTTSPPIYSTHVPIYETTPVEVRVPINDEL